MSTLEDLKGYAERATGLQRLGKRKAMDLVRVRKPHTVRFKDDGLIPNHPRWPLVIYRDAVSLDERHDPAAVIEDLFEANGWGDTWRNGIYDYVHYHSRIHELLGIARGKGRVRFGGKSGRIFTLKTGDIAIVPAGTGRPRAQKTIPKVPVPRKDPVYGAGRPLSKLWKKGK